LDDGLEFVHHGLQVVDREVDVALDLAATLRLGEHLFERSLPRSNTTSPYICTKRR